MWDACTNSPRDEGSEGRGIHFVVMVHELDMEDFAIESIGIQDLVRHETSSTEIVEKHE